MADGLYASFRLNLEQQGKRAKDLLKTARTGNAEALALLVDQPRSLSQLFGRMNYFVDPLPGQGDSQLRDRVLPMGTVSPPLFLREPGIDHDGRVRPPWTDVLSLTEAGRAVLRGELDFLSLRPSSRWVEGAQIGAGHIDWRWDENLHDAVRC